MNQAALCPSCKREVVFDTKGGSSVCPVCGAQFEVAGEASRRRKARPLDGVIFVAWMFAPAIVALTLVALLGHGQRQQFDKFYSDHGPLFIVLFILSCVSCYAACSWLMSRFTDKRWVRIVIGLVLGATILFCNVLIAFFGSCAFLRVM